LGVTLLLFLHPLTEAERLSQKFEDRGPVREAIQQCGRQLLIAKAFMLPSPSIV
jgi:hypothetical protein